MKFTELTEEHKQLLHDKSLTIDELSKILECGTITVRRWRKQVGSEISRGCKKGKSRPWQIKQIEKCCSVCNKSFVTIPSSKQQYCSTSCRSKDIDRSYMNTELFREKLRRLDTPEYRKYAHIVHRMTRKTYNEFKEEINPNNYIRGVAGKKDVYHLDHIVSVRFGFDNGIPPEDISRKENLQMLPWKDNIIKGK